MFINELAEPRLIVIYPGRFQPFHNGHRAVYDWLTGKFGRNNVWIATSNKVEGDRSPFNFAEKSYFMQLTGVPADRIIQASQPYQIENILSTGQITVADPANTVVIFAVSEKDMAEDPRFSFKPKKDGSDSYFQPLKDIKHTESMNQHGYIMTVPTFEFHVAGEPVRSATELRQRYADSDEQQRQKIIADLFGRYSREAEQIMNNKIPQSANVVSKPEKDPGAVAFDTMARDLATESISQFVPANPKYDDEIGYIKLLAHRYKKNPGLLSAKEKQALHNYINKKQKKPEVTEAELPASELNKLYQFKKQMSRPAPEPASEPTTEPAPAEDPVTQGDLATLKQRKAKLDTILNLKKELEALIPRAERTWGGMDRGIRADIELDYPTPTTDKEYDELIALYTRQVQQLKNYIQRKRSLYREDPLTDNWDTAQYKSSADQNQIPSKFVLQGYTVEFDKTTGLVKISQAGQLVHTFKFKGLPSYTNYKKYVERAIEQLSDNLNEEAAGVGVVKNSKDPRYVTATMGDQNDVTGDTLGKMMKAYRLVGVKAPKTGQQPVGKNIGKGLKEADYNQAAYQGIKSSNIKYNVPTINDPKVKEVVGTVVSRANQIFPDVEPGPVPDYVEKAKEFIRQAPAQARDSVVNWLKLPAKDPQKQSVVLAFVGAILARVGASTSHGLGLTPYQQAILFETLFPFAAGLIIAKMNGQDWKSSFKAGLAGASVGAGLTAATGVVEEREPYQQAIDQLSLHYIQKMSGEIDEITQRLNTEKLSPEYKQNLKDKIEKLKAERAKLLFDLK